MSGLVEETLVTLALVLWDEDSFTSPILVLKRLLTPDIKGAGQVGEFVH